MENLRAENVGKCGIILESGDERQRGESQLKLNQSRIFSAEIDFPNIESILKISMKRSALLLFCCCWKLFGIFCISDFPILPKKYSALHKQTTKWENVRFKSVTRKGKSFPLKTRPAKSVKKCLN